MGGWYQSFMLFMLPVLLAFMGNRVAVGTVAAVVASGGGAGANASIVLLPSLLDESFTFDGASSSDLARQFYQRYARGDVVEPMNSSLVEKLPDAVMKRLLNASASSSSSSSSQLSSHMFELLPGLLQRALVWDSGFVLDAKAGRFVQIWTTQGRSMAEIIVTKQEIATVTAAVTKEWQCTWTNCMQPNNATAYKAFDCKCGDTVELLVKCAVESNVDANNAGEDDQDSDTQSSLLWATGADPDAIPVPSISKYQCQGTQESGTNKTRQSSLWSIHTARQDDTSCSSTRFDSLVIPCLRMDSSNATGTSNVQLASMKEPKPSAWVNTWLKSAIALQLKNHPPRTSNSSNPTNSINSTNSASSSNSTQAPETQQPSTESSFKMVLLLPIVLGSLFVIAVIGFFFIRRTGSSSNRGGGQRGATTNSSIDITALLDPDSKDYL